MNSPHKLNKHIFDFFNVMHRSSVHFCFSVKMYAPFLYASPMHIVEKAIRFNLCGSNGATHFSCVASATHFLF